MKNSANVMYQLLFEQSRDAITIVDESGNFIDANSAFIKMMGFSHEELMSMNARLLWVHAEERAAWREAMARDGGVVDYESQQRTRNGALLNLLLTSTPRKEEDGRTVFQTILRDITEKKRNDQERENLIKELRNAQGVLTRTNHELVELRKKELEHLNNLRDELLLGQKIQQSFLPNPLPATDGWELDSAFMPAHEISGDFYDAFLINNNTMVIVIGDGSGKDISAALFMSCVQTLLRILSERDSTAGKSIVDTITTVNEFLCNFYRQSNRRIMYATMLYGLLDLATGNLRYVCAGHPNAFIAREGNIHRKLSVTGPAVGMGTGLSFSENIVELLPGDLLFSFTDGVTDAKSPTGEFFTNAPLGPLIAGAGGSAVSAVSAIREKLLAHLGDASPFDDITMLAVSRK